MKLQCKDKIPYYEGQILASLEEKIKNNTLQKLLIDISQNKFDNLSDDNPLKRFLPGLKENFINSGFMKRDGTLTSKGKEVAATGVSFNNLNGSFDISFVSNNKYLYITDCKLSENDESREHKKKWTNTLIPGTFGDKEYKTVAISVIKNVIPLQNQFLQKKESEVNVETSYDFETGKSKSEIKIGIGFKSLNIDTDDKSKFRLLDTVRAVARIKELGLPFYLDDDNCFWISDSMNIILDHEYAEPILNNVYTKGTFEYSSKKGDIKVSGCKLSIKSNRVREVLGHYLLKNIENRYLGYSEIGRLIMDFPECFENKSDIKDAINDSTEDIYNELKETAAEKNPKALRRLQAYQDLCPDMLLKDCEVKNKASIDYSGSEKSWSDIINEIFDNGGRDIKSVTTLSKYIYSNKWIAYNMGLISDCLEESGVKLNVIYSKDNSFENASWNKNPKPYNTIEKKWKEIKSIHDRYWKITRQDGSEEWFKVSGEVDALRYNQDNAGNITKDTKGNIKEMTVTFIKKSGVPDNVKQIFR